MNITHFDEPALDIALDEAVLTEAGILVVDEDPAFQLGLKTFLREFVGFDKVFTARNGREALDLVEREECIKLLTLDYQMPEMDGLEVLSRLGRQSSRPLAVIMITGFPSDDLKRKFANQTSSTLLATHFLSKPIEFEKLEPVILEAYDELCAAQRLTETMTGTYSGDLPAEREEFAWMASHRELMRRFDSLDEKVEANTASIANLRSLFADRSPVPELAKFALLTAILFMLWWLGWGRGPSQASEQILGLQPGGAEKESSPQDLPSETIDAIPRKKNPKKAAKTPRDF